MLAKRKVLERSGEGGKPAKNAWTKEAATDFSFCLFFDETRTDEETEAELRAAIEKTAAPGGHDVNQFQAYFCVDGFVFPGSALFINAICKGVASFNRAIFQNDADLAPSSIWLGSTAPPSNAVPRHRLHLPARFRICRRHLQGHRYVRRRHLPACSLVPQRHLYRRRRVRQRHLRGRC